jgi:nucleotide-binding universal stress UspA family protein
VPHEGILETATEQGADLIVMGSHGRRGLQRFLLGSVAQRVLSHADVPVMVVRG